MDVKNAVKTLKKVDWERVDELLCTGTFGGTVCILSDGDIVELSQGELWNPEASTEAILCCFAIIGEANLNGKYNPADCNPDWYYREAIRKTLDNLSTQAKYQES